MQPLKLTLNGFRGIRDGLGLEELTLELERLTDGAQLIAIAGANGSGKTTIMDNLTPFLGLPSRAACAGSGGFSYYDHVFLPESIKDLAWAHEGKSYRSQIVIRLSNLWPQAYGTSPWNAVLKDKLENRLHKEMCAGQITLEAARAMLVNDWREAYKRYYGEP